MSSSIARYTHKFVPLLRRFLPVIAWLPADQRADLRPDLMAGAISWAVMVPVAMAYAEMAGLPAQAGFYASIAWRTGWTHISSALRLPRTRRAASMRRNKATVSSSAISTGVQYFHAVMKGDIVVWHQV